MRRAEITRARSTTSVSNRPDIDRVVAVAARVLSETWRTPVTLRLQDPIRSEWGRHTLVRCDVDGARATDTPTVVVKAAVERNGAIFNEWAALRWLRRVDAVSGLVPELYAGDVATELIVLEDVGTGPLLRRVLHTRPEWATEALCESMRLLGRVHAATRGRSDDLAATRAGLPPGPPPPAIAIAPEALTLEMRSWRPVPESVREEITLAAETMRPEPEVAALTFHDVCPPNRVVTPTGVRAVDLEMAGFRHPMIDAAYAVIGHLRCNDGLVIPPPIRRRMTEAYVGAISSGYPEYADPDRFGRDLVGATVVWFADLLRRFGAAARRDRTVGFFRTSARQRVLAAIDVLDAVTTASSRTTAIGAWAAALRNDMSAAWGAVPRLATFPGLESPT
jgi:hypothetical protein